MAGRGLGVGGGLGWELELWAGAVLVSGATGLLLSFLVVPIRTVVSRESRVQSPGTGDSRLATRD